jgi:hypothetical protein
MWVVKMLAAAEEVEKRQVSSCAHRYLEKNSGEILTSSTDRVSDLGNQQDHGSDRSDT